MLFMIGICLLLLFYSMEVRAAQVKNKARYGHYLVEMCNFVENNQNFNVQIIYCHEH